eukprot:1116970-Karenia_brevis.AAC.1
MQAQLVPHNEILKSADVCFGLLFIDALGASSMGKLQSLMKMPEDLWGLDGNDKAEHLWRSLTATGKLVFRNVFKDH